MNLSSQNTSWVRSDDFKPVQACDTTCYTISYLYDSVQDTSHIGIKTKEPMRLYIGNHTVCFCSYAQEQADSLNEVSTSKGEYSCLCGSFNVSWCLFKNYPRYGYYALTDKIGRDRFVCIEPIDQPRWQLVADSTAVILGYTCELATACYRGRVWNAWYSEEIPMCEGPWRLCGLPGLVLRAYDSNGYFRFEANGIEKSKKPKPLYYRGGNYEKINRRSLINLYKRYFADPRAYLQNNPSLKVIMEDENGNSLHPQNLPYNLLERE